MKKREILDFETEFNYEFPSRTKAEYKELQQKINEIAKEHGKKPLSLKDITTMVDAIQMAHYWEMSIAKNGCEKSIREEENGNSALTNKMKK